MEACDDECTPPNAGNFNVYSEPLPSAEKIVRRSLKPAFVDLPIPLSRRVASFDGHRHTLISCSILGYDKRVSPEIVHIEKYVSELAKFLAFTPPMGTIATGLLHAISINKVQTWPSFNPELIVCEDVELVLVCMVISYKISCDEQIQLKWLTPDVDKWMQIEIYVVKYISLSLVELANIAMQEHSFSQKLENINSHGGSCPFFPSLGGFS